MKLLSTIVLCCSFLFTGCLLAQYQGKVCACKNCQCTEESNCGCLSNQGCHCGKDCPCGQNCGCGRLQLSISEPNFHHSNSDEHEKA